MGKTDDGRHPSAGSCAGCRPTATATSPSTCAARSPSRWATRATSCAARGRHRLHALQVQSLPSPLPRVAGCGEARRGGGRRAGARVPHHLAARVHAGAQLHEVPQPHGHGHRGDDPRPADGRRGADGRLRQDRAGAADGRGQRRQARDPTDRRPADDLALQGRPRRRLHRLPQVLDPVPRRQARHKPRSRRSRGGSSRRPAPAP